MVNALQERPSPSPDRQSARRSWAPRLVGAALVAVLAVVGVDRAAGLLPSWDSPLEEQVVDHQRPALMLALSDLTEYHASQGTFQVVVDLERNTPWVPGMVKGERTTYLASGTVDGLVDLEGLGKGDVQVDGESVVLTLPAPRLGEPALDLEDSRVVSRERGVVDRIAGAFSDSPTSERDVALLAEEKLAQAAADSDVLRRAEENTRAMLLGLTRSFGYSDVVVRFEDDPRDAT